MTNFRTKPDAMDVAIYMALSSRMGRTALEVWDRCPGYSYQAVRKRLIEMANIQDIKTVAAGEPGRPVREYLAWR